MRVTTAGNAATGFCMSPPRLACLRDYSGDDLADLEPVYELVEKPADRHKLMIPGSMVRLMRQWHSDLWVAIEEKRGQVKGAADAAEWKRRQHAPDPQATPGRQMSSGDEDFSQLDDVAFLAERRRVREELEHMPEHEVSAELAARFQAVNEEFLRRARLAWTSVG
jgi:hypothetical protein